MGDFNAELSNNFSWFCETYIIRSLIKKRMLSKAQIIPHAMTRFKLTDKKVFKVLPLLKQVHLNSTILLLWYQKVTLRDLGLRNL